MLFDWLTSRRRRKLLAEPFPESWREWLGDYPFYEELDDVERGRLEAILRTIVAETRFEGCGGLELTPDMPVVIAGMASLLLLGIEDGSFGRVSDVLVYPEAFVTPEGEAHVGEAWYRGPVILSWEDVVFHAEYESDGANVVLHEFAHRLDMLDGVFDGTPPLPDKAAYERWARVMSASFEELRTLERGRRRTTLDPYGATDEAEFFAVATESFFEQPRRMQRRLPDLYDLLRDYYRQDPAQRAAREHGGSRTSG